MYDKTKLSIAGIVSLVLSPAGLLVVRGWQKKKEDDLTLRSLNFFHAQLNCA